MMEGMTQQHCPYCSPLPATELRGGAPPAHIHPQPDKQLPAIIDGLVEKRGQVFFHSTWFNHFTIVMLFLLSLCITL